jgi:KamA family protein
MFYSFNRFSESEFADYLTSSELEDLSYLTRIFPFKTSRYVLEELIDWNNREEDPIFKLVFPAREMLADEHWEKVTSASSPEEERRIIMEIRQNLNPNPDGQLNNIPRIGNRTFGGIQHKYEETVLFFPAQGQTCHSYCTYCFRWAQFVNLKDHKFKSKDQQDLFDYLNCNRQVTDVLITGGDPMWMKNEQLFQYLDTIMSPELSHVKNIRIGTKSLAFYPERFLGEQGDVLIQKFEELISKGKNVAIMAHFSHPKELSTEKVQEALYRIRKGGVVIRSQAPLIKGINDDSDTWKNMWNMSVNLGIVPYYMFIERDTGAHEYFSVPLADAYQIFTEAYSEISGLAKTVRGPSMSAWPGKVMIDGIVGHGDNKKFVLKFIQSRNPDLINQPFFAKYDEEATWLDDLEIEPSMNQYIREMGEDQDDEEDEIIEVA